MELVEGRIRVGTDGAFPDVGAFVDRLGTVADEYGVTVQAFDARYVVSRAHLERAVELADRAIERGENVARERAVEVLLYAAGRRQIDRALAMGVGEGETPVVVLVDGGDEEGGTEAVAALLTPTPTLGAFDEERVCSFFEVTPAERAATERSLDELVLERVALLDVEK